MDLLSNLSDTEVKFVTKLLASLVDKTLKPGAAGDEVFDIVVKALNQVLKLNQSGSLVHKFEIMELCTRAWLAWYAYEEDNNPVLLADIVACGKKIIELLDLDPTGLI